MKRLFTQSNIDHCKRDVMRRKFAHDVPSKQAPVFREAILQLVEDGEVRAYPTAGKNFRWIVSNGPVEHDPNFPFVSRRNEGEEIDD